MKGSKSLVGLIAGLFMLGLGWFFNPLGLTETLKSHKHPLDSSEVKGNVLLIKHSEIFGDLEYAPVLFHHGKHVKSLEKEGCNVCHPSGENGTLRFVFPKEFLSLKDPEKLKDLYHQACIQCHQQKKSEGKPYGPVRLSCGDCHVNRYFKKDITYPMFDFDWVYHANHVKELDQKCEKCHHTYDLEEADKTRTLKYVKGKEESCYYCHDFSRKRGPELTQILKVAQEKGLSLSQAYHGLCLNCHVDLKKEDKKAGPITCSECHKGETKTLEALAQAPRPDRGQKDFYFMEFSKGSKMQGVVFNHKVHQFTTKKCRDCHHERLEACRNCHTLEGIPKGNFVNAVTAFHSLYSERTCQGCHQKEIKARAECLACHHLDKKDTSRTEIASKDSCFKCHTGKQKAIFKTLKPYSGKIEPKIEIEVLSKEFEKAILPHKKIIESLSNKTLDNRLSVYFHQEEKTLCKGCHHKARVDEKTKGQELKCVNCHGIEFNPLHPERPRLQAAYHGQCIKCHEYLRIEKAMTCDSCHTSKKERSIIRF
ncbi:cytochrome c3 family protein [Thermodesulfobacterium sp. TA1]|uniref:sulfate respiration complex hexadecaheme cytochrome HmcA n=1 Tax=Thermodesulfobacterium sp. TA1 TaxID=2234087 RepID=UPI001231F732|nr:cytochrome c3 family protein [Thermodesulfobacterium sp. TA1]QER42658.1 cytochrome c3 family protein [Thermodesulfobacterium sp. TA1]